MRGEGRERAPCVVFATMRGEITRDLGLDVRYKYTETHHSQGNFSKLFCFIYFTIRLQEYIHLKHRCKYIPPSFSLYALLRFRFSHYFLFHISLLLTFFLTRYSPVCTHVDLQVDISDICVNKLSSG